MTRKQAIDHLRFAGYHGDRAAFTRLYVENRISNTAAKQAYSEGVQMKANGMRCNCSACQAK